MDKAEQPEFRLGKDSFRIGEWTVHPTLHQVSRNGRAVRLEPKVSLLLLTLAKAGGNAVSRDDLHRRVWHDTFVTDKALTSGVAKLRRALDDSASAPRYIGTVAKGGYRLLAPVTLDTAEHHRPDDATRRRSRRPVLAGMTLAAVLLAAILLAAGATRGPGAENHVPPPTTTNVTTQDGFELHPSISPGGETVAYSRADDSGNWDLYLSRPGSDRELRLTEDPARDVRPVWSPDGARIAFLRFTDDTCRLMTMPALGGEPTQITWCAEFVPARVFWGPKLDWSSDGRFIAWPWRDTADAPVAIRAVDLATGLSHPLTRPPAWHSDGQPAYSPDGRWLAFSRRRGRSPGDLWIVPLDKTGQPAGPEQQVSFERRVMMGHAWLPDSREVLLASNRDGTFNLWAFPLQGGTPRWIPAPGANLKEPTLSTDGRHIAYENWNYDENIWRLDLASLIPELLTDHRTDPGAQAAGRRDTAAIVRSAASQSTSTAPQIVATGAQRLIASSLWDSGPTYSPDGSTVAFVSNRSGSYEIWITDAQGGAPRRLSNLNAGVIGPITWRPDGSALVFEARPEGLAHLYEVAVSGGTVRQITFGPHDDVLPQMAPDDETLWFASNRSGEWQIWRMTAGEASQVTRDGGYAARLTADGEGLVFTRPGKDGLWEMPLRGGDPRLALPALAERDFGNWTLHGRHVVFVRRDVASGQTRLALHDLATGSSRDVFVPANTVMASRRGLSISPDGRWLLFTALDDATSDLLLVRDLRLR